MKCPYFNQSHINLYMRESLAPCFKRKGKVCHAVVYGDDVLHTITGKSYCKAPVPSDTAIALSALGAVIEVSTENGVREVPAHSFYRGDGEANIKPNEIVTKIVLPRKAGHGSAFRCYKPGPGCFAVVSAVAVLTLDEDGKTCGGLELCLGGVAQKPYPAAELVEPLLHRKLTGEGISQVTQALFQDVEITNDDVLFKVAKARALCREALMQAWSRAQGGK